MSAHAPQLLYTSAPEGLERGAVGFCVVAATPGLPRGAAAAAEGLSGYRHAGPPGDPANPVVLMHVRLPRNAGHGRHVLARVSDAGRDYTGRQNKLARLAFVDESPPRCGPAAALAAPPFSPGEKWNGTVGELPPWSPPADRPAGVCRTWAQAGEVGWAGVLAAGVLSGDRAPIALILPAGGGEETSRQALALFAEAIALLPPGRRWDATFTTHDGPRPAGAECRWRAAPAGSAEAKALRRLRGATVLDLTNPAALAAALPTAAALKPAIAAARAGRPLAGAEAPFAAAAPAESILTEGAAPPPAFPDDPTGAPDGGVIFEEGAPRAAPAGRGSSRPTAPPRSRAHTPPPMPGGRSRKGLWIGAASAAVLLLVVGVGVAVTLTQPELFSKLTGTTPAEAEGVAANAASPETKDDAAAPNAGTAEEATPEQDSSTPGAIGTPAVAGAADAEGDGGLDGNQEAMQVDVETAIAPATEPAESAMPDAVGESGIADAGTTTEPAPETEPAPIKAPATPAPLTLVRAPIEGAIEGNALRTKPLGQPVEEVLDGPLAQGRLWLPITLLELERGQRISADANKLLYGSEEVLSDTFSLLEISASENRVVLVSSRNPKGLTKEQVVRLGSAGLLTSGDAETADAGLCFWAPLSADQPEGGWRLEGGRLIVRLDEQDELPAFARAEVNVRALVRVQDEPGPVEVAAVFEPHHDQRTRTGGKLAAVTFDETHFSEDADVIAKAATWAKAFRTHVQGAWAAQRLTMVEAAAGWVPASYPPQGKDGQKYEREFRQGLNNMGQLLGELAKRVEDGEPGDFDDDLAWSSVEDWAVDWPLRPKIKPEKGFDPQHGLEPPELRKKLAEAEQAHTRAVRRTSGRVTGATFFYRVRAAPFDEDSPTDAVILLEIGDAPKIPAP